MEYAQERVATLHDYGDADPAVPVDRATVVVPMTEREYAGLAAERVLSELAAVDPARVLVPLRAPASEVGEFADWLASFAVDVDVLWCSGPRLADLLADHGLDGRRGKGRDVWLALGQVETDFVVCHDADARTYEAADVRKLLYPLAGDFAFSKGYYARIEEGRLYGRLCRLLYEPLVAALCGRHPEEPLLAYLDAFRYALAGEFGLTRELARSMPLRRRWGLEVGTLASAFEAVGADAVAQVDLGRYEHDHRAVSGPTGLTEMSEGVAEALLSPLESRGVEPDYGTLRDDYRETARRYVRAYGADAGFNGLDYDREAELDQVAAYADAIAAPGPDTRLPAWTDAPIDAAAVAAAAREDLDEAA